MRWGKSQVAQEVPVIIPQASAPLDRPWKKVGSLQLKEICLVQVVTPVLRTALMHAGVEMKGQLQGGSFIYNRRFYITGKDAQQARRCIGNNGVGSG